MKTNKEIAKKLYDKLFNDGFEQIIVFGEKVRGLRITETEMDFLNEPFEISYSIKNKDFEHKSESKVYGEFVKYADGSIYMTLRSVNYVVHIMHFLQEIMLAYEAQEIVEEEQKNDKADT